MGMLIGLLVKKGLSEKAARVLCELGLVLLVCAVCVGIVAYIRHDAVADHERKLEQRAAPARTDAAVETAVLAAHSAERKQEMHDVIAAQPTQPIAPTTRALGCERLRRAGRSSPHC